MFLRHGSRQKLYRYWVTQLKIFAYNTNHYDIVWYHVSYYYSFFCFLLYLVDKFFLSLLPQVDKAAPSIWLSWVNISWAFSASCPFVAISSQEWRAHEQKSWGSRPRTKLHSKTLFEIAMALSTINVSFPSKSRFSAIFAILLQTAQPPNPKR